MRKALQARIQRILRGHRASQFLRLLGVNPKHFWLLVDLFDSLSERGEMLDQLGRDGIALQTAALLYSAILALMSAMFALAQIPPVLYLSICMAFTAFLLLTVLLSETGNSIVNPTEGIVLAHYPVNGATYLAAKLTHLVWIVFYLAVGINTIPALVGLELPGSGWTYPLLHLLSALATGIVVALSCCALFGWLIRFVPTKRLKAAGQLAGIVPLLFVMAGQQLLSLLARFHLFKSLSIGPSARWALGLAAGVAAVAAVAFGVRSLSADYLIRVSSLMHAGWRNTRPARKSWIGEMVARFFGGQPGRAAFAFVSQMARRDYQFRRQVLPMSIVGMIGLVRLVTQGGESDPFSGPFTVMHLLPHLFGGILLLGCSLLPYGDQSRAAWVFLLTPSRVFDRFARGVHAALWIQLILIPHALLLLFLIWRWGMWHAGLFIAFSLAAASLYLAFWLRLIDCVPFTKPVDLTRAASLLPLMMLFGVVTGVAVGLQYFFVFRSQLVVVVVTLVVAAAAYFFTRQSLDAFASSIRFNLGLLSVESGTLYQEIDG